MADNTLLLLLYRVLFGPSGYESVTFFFPLAVSETIKKFKRREPRS